MNLIYEYAPSVSLLFFFGVFLFVAFRTYRPSAKQEMREHGFIPLKDQ